MPELDGKVALITGAASGLGAGMARTLSAPGSVDSPDPHAVSAMEMATPNKAAERTRRRVRALPQGTDFMLFLLED